MIECQFKRAGEVWYCTNCGERSPLAAPVARTCQRLADPPCRHLGSMRTHGSRDPERPNPQAGRPVLIQVTCDTCQGKRTQIAQPVARCELHGACLPLYAPSGEIFAEFRQRDDALAVCAHCPDRRPAD